MTYSQTLLKNYEEKSEEFQAEMDKIEEDSKRSLCDIQNARMADRKVRLKVERDNYLAAARDLRKKIPLE